MDYPLKYELMYKGAMEVFTFVYQEHFFENIPEFDLFRGRTTKETVSRGKLEKLIQEENIE